MYDLIFANKEIFKIIYAAIIVAVCAFIVVRTDKLYHLSLHNGIRYFRNAFFFYGAAFFVRYFLGIQQISNFVEGNYPSFVNFAFEFLMVMAGFSLLYSLVWKRIESEDEYYYTSLFNKRIILFYFMSAIIAAIDYIWGMYSVMLFSQTILFFFASIVSYNNYRDRGKKHRFLKFYFFAMILSFIAWAANTVSALWLNWDKNILVLVYLLNVVVFLLFLYGVKRVTGNKKIVRL